LNGAAAVSVGVGDLELLFGKVGITLEQEWADGGSPGEVDELLMGLNGVGVGGAGSDEKEC